MHATPHRRLVALALVGLLLSSCVTTQLPPVSSAGAQFEPERDELELWNEARLEEVRLRSAVALYQDPALETYLDRVADRLTPPPMAANPHLHFEVWVVDDPTLNAFAYPHGPLYVHTGLLARMENEAQLATVLGHEMSHVEHRHMLRYRRALQNKQVALLTASIAAEILLAGEEYHQWKDGDWGEAVLVSVLGDVIIGLGLQLAFLASVNGYGRDLEAEADQGGFHKLAAAGYDPQQAPRLYEILLDGAGGENGRTENFFFGSHPRLTDRITNARGWVEGAPPPGGDEPLETGEEEFRRHLRPVVLHEAWSNLDAGYLDLAEAHALKALDWDPEDARVHHLLGRVLLARADEAERADDPDAARALREDARLAFHEAVRLDADLPGPHRELGFLHYDAGLLSDACRELGFYVDLAPDAEDAHRVHAYLQDLQDQGAC